ncbi:unnamed protein product [Trichogramma brassicae]|uniref:Uncharacterized protein n=1 Tax=Trichogramma brassicae TaxID=86971 RepID=A0A6H5I475_9HYME|nr:unnamed protein product [Trichogramma brassicae]
MEQTNHAMALGDNRQWEANFGADHISTTRAATVNNNMFFVKKVTRKPLLLHDLDNFVGIQIPSLEFLARPVVSCFVCQGLAHGFRCAPPICRVMKEKIQTNTKLILNTNQILEKKTRSAKFSLNVLLTVVLDSTEPRWNEERGKRRFNCATRSSAQTFFRIPCTTVRVRGRPRENVSAYMHTSVRVERRTIRRSFSSSDRQAASDKTTNAQTRTFPRSSRSTIVATIEDEDDEEEYDERHIIYKLYKACQRTKERERERERERIYLNILRAFQKKDLCTRWCQRGLVIRRVYIAILFTRRGRERGAAALHDPSTSSSTSLFFEFTCTRVFIYVYITYKGCAGYTCDLCSHASLGSNVGRYAHTPVYYSGRATSINLYCTKSLVIKLTPAAAAALHLKKKAKVSFEVEGGEGRRRRREEEEEAAAEAQEPVENRLKVSNDRCCTRLASACAIYSANITRINVRIYRIYLRVIRTADYSSRSKPIYIAQQQQQQHRYRTAVVYTRYVPRREVHLNDNRFEIDRTAPVAAVGQNGLYLYMVYT